MNNVRN